MAERGILNAKALAVAVPSVPYGSLRNAVSGTDPINLQRVYAIARALRRPGEELHTVVNDILAKDDDEVEARTRPKDTRAPASPRQPAPPTKDQPKPRPTSGSAA